MSRRAPLAGATLGFAGATLALAAACSGAPPATPTALPTAAPSTLPPRASASVTQRPYPTVTASPSSPATPTATPDPLHTACDHPYWPLREGATWESRVDDGTRTVSVVGVTGDEVEAVATLRQAEPDGAIHTIEVLCGPDGLAFGDASVAYPDGPVGTKTTVGRAGVVLPPADELEPGATYRWSLTADLSWPVFADGLYTGNAGYRNMSRQDCTVIGPEDVRLGDALVPAVRIACEGESVSTSADGSEAISSFDATLLYPEGVGPLDPTPGHELLRFEIP